MSCLPVKERLAGGREEFIPDADATKIETKKQESVRAWHKVNGYLPIL